MGDAVARRVERDGSLFDNCGSAVLCHDDLHEGNVLVAQRPGGWQVTGVIDVENAIVADPLQRDFPAPARARNHRRPRQTSSEAGYDEEHLRTECALGGSATNTWVFIEHANGAGGGYGGPDDNGNDDGWYTTYAGPVYVYAPHECIEVGGGTVVGNDAAWPSVMCG